MPPRGEVKVPRLVPSLAEEFPPDLLQQTRARRVHGEPTPSRDPQSALQNVVDYNVAAVVGQSAAFIRAIVLARILGPEVLGLWTALVLVYTYGLLSEVGLVEGMQRLVPLRSGAGRTQEARTIQNTAFTATMLATSSLALALGLVGFLAPGLTLEQRVGVATMALAVVLYRLSQFVLLPQFFALRYAVNRNGAILAAATEAVLSIGLAPFLGIYAMCIGFLAGFVAMSLYVWNAARPKYEIQLDLPSLRTTILTGVPIMLAGSGGTFVASADRIVAASALPLVFLGYYGLGITLRGVVSLMPSAVANALYYRILDRLGRVEQDVKSVEMAFRHSMLGSGLLSAFLAAGMLAMTNFIPVVLPLYRDGIDVIRIAILGGFFLAIGALPSLYLIAAGRSSALLGIQTLSGILGLGGSYLAVLLQGGIEAVAWVGTGTLAVSGIALLALSFRTFGTTLGAFARDITEILLPGALLVGIGSGVHAMMAGLGSSISDVMLRTAVELAAIAAASIPLVLLVDRRTGMMPRVREYIATLTRADAS